MSVGLVPFMMQSRTIAATLPGGSSFQIALAANGISMQQSVWTRRGRDVSPVGGVSHQIITIRGTKLSTPCCLYCMVSMACSIALMQAADESLVMIKAKEHGCALADGSQRMPPSAFSVITQYVVPSSATMNLLQSMPNTKAGCFLACKKAKRGCKNGT